MFCYFFSSWNELGFFFSFYSSEWICWNLKAFIQISATKKCLIVHFGISFCFFPCIKKKKKSRWKGARWAQPHLFFCAKTHHPYKISPSALQKAAHILGYHHILLCIDWLFSICLVYMFIIIKLLSKKTEVDKESYHKSRDQLFVIQKYETSLCYQNWED